jgi:GT2 family glycosyltransferase
MPGNGVLIPRSVFEKVGFYDERHMPQYHADSDLVLRTKSAGYQPVIALRAVLYNHMLEKPLVTTRWSLVFSKKSDRYWKPLWATLRRHGPFGRRLYLLWLQYWPFFYPRWIAPLSCAVRRALHLPMKGESIREEKPRPAGRRDRAAPESPGSVRAAHLPDPKVANRA